jgi:hypothetical protein
VWKGHGSLTLAERIPTIKSWIADCQKAHELCDVSFSQGLPTRLIELMDDSKRRARKSRLIYSKTITNKKTASYMTLSHCVSLAPPLNNVRSNKQWGTGDSRPLVTLRNSEEEYRKVIPDEVLPKTFKDAFETAWAHGLRYIWIDSLCMYPGRSRTKCCRNLRLNPLICEGVGFRI